MLILVKEIRQLLSSPWAIIIVFLLTRLPGINRTSTLVTYQGEENAVIFDILNGARSLAINNWSTPFHLVPIAPFTGKWSLHTSYPPLLYYLFSPLFKTPLSPDQIVTASRLFMLTITSVGAYFVFRILQKATFSPWQAAIGQLLFLFYFPAYIRSDVLWLGDVGVVVGLVQIYCLIQILDNTETKRWRTLTTLLSVIGPLIYWYNSLVALTFFFLTFIYKKSSMLKKIGFLNAAIALSVASLVLTWNSLAELQTESEVRGVIGSGIPRVIHGNLLTTVLFWDVPFGPLEYLTFYAVYFLRYIIPVFPFVSDVRIFHQLGLQFLLPIYKIPFVLIVIPFVMSMVFLVPIVIFSIKGYQIKGKDYIKNKNPLFHLLLFTLPGVIYTISLVQWSFSHSYNNVGVLAGLGISLGLGFYIWVQDNISRFLKKRGMNYLYGSKLSIGIIFCYVLFWGSLNVVSTYQIRAIFISDPYVVAVNSALKWARENLPQNSVLISTLPWDWKQYFVNYFSKTSQYSADGFRDLGYPDSPVYKDPDRYKNMKEPENWKQFKNYLLTESDHKLPITLKGKKLKIIHEEQFDLSSPESLEAKARFAWKEAAWNIKHGQLRQLRELNSWIKYPDKVFTTKKILIMEIYDAS